MSSVTRTPPPAQVEALRSFNRDYTRRIGVLAPYLDSDFSLTEVRVLYELAHREQPTARDLARDLGLDEGYLSRILRRFRQKGWLASQPSPADARQQLLALTGAGRKVFAPLEKKSRAQAQAVLAPLNDAGRESLVQALATVRRLLDPTAEPAATRTVVLRESRPGDMGWVIQQHGEIYFREYGWNSEFEALVADIVARMMRHHRPDLERSWIAEVDGRRVGSVFVVRKSATVAQLRLLILTPEARGLGLGSRLTDECIAFARSKGYRKLLLWTNSCLLEARRIYARRGFVLVKSEAYQGFGKDLVGETWELRL
jgi:DNA-binding MarR family transcriptional regulator/GNAT superfamily N-acetyltransferase